jgi:hypothetical protein
VSVVSDRPRLLNSLDATVSASQYISHSFLQVLEGLVEWQPDMMSEIAEYLRHTCHVDVSPPTIKRMLHRPAIEQDEQDRAAFKMLVGEHFKPEHLVFVDESHFSRRSLRRNYACAPPGDCARRRDFLTRGKW